MKRIVLDLMCELSEYEVTERAQALSSTVVRLDEVEIAKKTAMKSFNDSLEELNGSIRRYSRVIRDRAESRPVVCGLVFHSPSVGTKRTVRLDTGDIVKEEPMSSTECQNNLFDKPDGAEETPTEADELQREGVLAEAIETLGNSVEMADAMDALVEPVLTGAVTSITINAVDQEVVIDRPAAERVRRRAREVKEEKQEPAKPNGFD